MAPAASGFAAGTQGLKTISAETHVDLIVTGTLLSAGDEIRASPRLTEAATRTLICSHSTQTSIGQVFQLQDELTECDRRGAFLAAHVSRAAHAPAALWRQQCVVDGNCSRRLPRLYMLLLEELY